MKELRLLLWIGMTVLIGMSLVSSALAQDHIVGESVLRDSIRETALERKAQMRRVEEFFSSPEVTGVLERYSFLGLERITEGVSQLSEQELATLTQQIEELDEEVRAGALSNEHLTYIVIALAAAVIVLIAVN